MEIIVIVVVEIEIPSTFNVCSYCEISGAVCPSRATRTTSD